MIERLELEIKDDEYGKITVILPSDYVVFSKINEIIDAVNRMEEQISRMQVTE